MRKPLNACRKSGGGWETDLDGLLGEAEPGVDLRRTRKVAGAHSLEIFLCTRIFEEVEAKMISFIVASACSGASVVWGTRRTVWGSRRREQSLTRLTGSSAGWRQEGDRRLPHPLSLSPLAHVFTASLSGQHKGEGKRGRRAPPPLFFLLLLLLLGAFPSHRLVGISPFLELGGERMAGAGPIAIGGLAASELSPCRCLCSAVDAHQASSFHLRNGPRHLGQARPRSTRLSPTLGQLSSAFAGDWSAVGGALARPSKPRRRRSLVVISAELGGQYEEGFEDVHLQLINYFTYKAVRTVLHQLYEMNPPKYMWFYNFVATNKPEDGKRFLRLLGKEKQDLAERVMITRLHLYGKWIKKCDHAKMYQRISDENLELMRERLIETVIWPSDDTNSERVG